MSTLISNGPKIDPFRTQQANSQSFEKWLPMDTKNVSHKDISQNYSKQFQTGWHAEGIDINESGGPQHQNWQENREWGGPGQRWLVFPPGSVGITVLTSSGYFLLLLLNINNHNSRVRPSRFTIHLNVSRLKHLSFFSQEQNLSGAEPDEFNNRSVVIFPIHQTWWEVAVH